MHILKELQCSPFCDRCKQGTRGGCQDSHSPQTTNYSLTSPLVLSDPAGFIVPGVQKIFLVFKWWDIGLCQHSGNG